MEQRVDGHIHAFALGNSKDSEHLRNGSLEINPDTLTAAYASRAQRRSQSGSAAGHIAIAQALLAMHQRFLLRALLCAISQKMPDQKVHWSLSVDQSRHSI
jgi:hypothetical protein